jgi:hypothetical protein
MPVFTFGSNHSCPQCGHGMGRSYVELPSREAMIALYGVKWSHEYTSQREAGVERYYLQRCQPGRCACGRMDGCIGCGVLMSGGNLCNECEVD